jgi:hypothetical protein
MENSVRQDYMTEKMWDALAAGCIPIYLGSSNAPHIIPDPNSVIMGVLKSGRPGDRHLVQGTRFAAAALFTLHG